MIIVSIDSVAKTYARTSNGIVFIQLVYKKLFLTEVSYSSSIVLVIICFLT